MSKGLVLKWVEQTLAPYVATAPNGIIPLLSLDSYSVHLMGSVSHAINALGVEVIIIPPGCTSVVQPVDIGYNKPFKGLVREKYEEWMIHDSEDLSKPPRQVDVARWIADAECEMKRSTMVNAWMRHDLEYFPRASPMVDVPPVLQVPMGEDVTNLISLWGAVIIVAFFQLSLSQSQTGVVRTQTHTVLSKTLTWHNFKRNGQNPMKPHMGGKLSLSPIN